MKMERRKENFKIKLKMPPRGVLYIRKITHWVFYFSAGAEAFFIYNSGGRIRCREKRVYPH